MVFHSSSLIRQRSLYPLLSKNKCTPDEARHRHTFSSLPLQFVEEARQPICSTAALGVLAFPSARSVSSETSHPAQLRNRKGSRSGGAPPLEPQAQPHCLTLLAVEVVASSSARSPPFQTSRAIPAGVHKSPTAVGLFLRPQMSHRRWGFFTPRNFQSALCKSRRPER